MREPIDTSGFALSARLLRGLRKMDKVLLLTVDVEEWYHSRWRARGLWLLEIEVHDIRGKRPVHKEG